MCRSADVDWDAAGWQFLRGLRASRSQREFSRALGYRSNVACNWEQSRRFPTGRRTLAICQELGVDVVGALAGFAPGVAYAPAEVGAWLDALRGKMSLTTLARATGRSHSTISRWLRGRTEPRLPHFLQLVQAITGRVAELVEALVPHCVPELLLPELYERAERHTRAVRLRVQRRQGFERWRTAHRARRVR